MNNWSENLLSNHVSLITKGTTPTSIGKTFQESGIIFIKAESITESGEFILDSLAYIDEETHELLKRSQLHDGDILFSIAGVLGRIAIVNSSILPANTNQAIALIRLSTNTEIESDFLKYFLNSEFIKEQIRRINVQSAQANFSLGDINRLVIKYPKDKTEQRQIATMLSTADVVIKITQAVIAKYKAIKQGMLQDLFTRGIDTRTGKLRPSYHDAPEMYKESRLGWIPMEWEVESLEDLCSERPTYGINAAAVDFTYQLPTYIRITDIDDDGNFSKTGRKCVNSEFSHQYILKIGDLVFARTGATVGKTYLYNEADGILVYAGFLIKVSPNQKLLVADFLKYLTETPYYLNWVGTMSQRSGQPGINGNEYGSFLVPKPNLTEQKLIAQRMNSLNRKLQIEQDFLHKQQQIKTGLMNDLLSGRKKVIVKLETVTHE